jgi:AhpD family alkylhydroperoxidase
MSRIPIHTLDSAPAAAREALTMIQNRYGKTFNLYGQMAHNPVVLAAYRGMEAALETHGRFEESTIQAIALAVSAGNECRYCEAGHTFAGQRAGLTLEQTIAARRGDPLDPKLDPLLAVARYAATNRGAVDEHLWQQAVDAGWSDEDLAELFTHIAFYTFTNYFSHYGETEVDLPPAPPL